MNLRRYYHEVSTTIRFIKRDNLPTWEPPTEFPDPKQITEICIDLETYDPELKRKALVGQRAVDL